MVEKLFLSFLVVNLVFFFCKAMIFVCIYQHDERLFHTAHRAVHFNTLVPVYSTVFIAKSHKQRCFYFCCIIHRGISHMLFHSFIPRTIKSTLAGFEDSCIRSSCIPVNRDRKSTRLNSSHSQISYAVFCLKKKKKKVK